MELRDDLQEKKKKAKNNDAENKINMQEESIQYNSQDLDQEQRVDVNPMQLNTQNFRVFIKNDKNRSSGKITGTTYLEKNNEMVSNTVILLYFGGENSLPVYKTNSDHNGNFIIDDLPPGYYTICAEYESNFKYHSHYFKVFPGQNVHLSILLLDKRKN